MQTVRHWFIQVNMKGVPIVPASIVGNFPHFNFASLLLNLITFQ